MSTDKKKKEQHHIDPIFKKVMLQFGKQYNLDLRTEVEVSHLPRTIDIVLYLPSDEEITKVEANSAFKRLREHGQIEFKAKNDRLTVAGYYIIRGRSFLYLGENKLDSSQLCVTIVSAGKPRSVLARAELNFQSLGDGYYWSEGHPPVIIIVINELPIEVRTYPLLIFASEEKKFREFLRTILKEERPEYLVYAYRVRPKVTKEELEMAGNVRGLSQEQLQFMAQDIGKELVTFLKPEERLAGLAPQERLAGLAPKERLAGLKAQEVFGNYRPEEIRRYLEQLEQGKATNGA